MDITRNRVRRSASPYILLALFLLIAPITAADLGKRYVTLRDGSVLIINLTKAPAFTLNPDEPNIPATDIAEAIFSSEAAGAAIRLIRKLVADLKAPQFAVRQNASSQLLRLSPGFGSLLSELKESTTDPEVRQRINAILAKTPQQRSSAAGFDLLITHDGKRLTGDIGNWSAEVNYRGHLLKLSRKNVATIKTKRPDPSSLPSVSIPGDRVLTALREDDDGALPKSVFRTGFETDPGGNPLEIGEDISSRFASAGFEISTSVKGGIVSVNDFAVQGRSKGLSAATHAPLWEGTLTIRFHAPNHPGTPAFVTSAGCWVASVSPDGTALEAYDATGDLVGTVKTKRSGHEFLAFRSPVPIAEIRVVPDPAIDSNYTIDDLFFTPPKPLGIYPEPGWCVFRTRDGERLLAESFSMEGSLFSLRDLSYGAENMSLGKDAVTAFAPPVADVPKKEPPAPEDIHWILSKDGSQLRATRIAHPEHRWATFPSVKIPSPSVAAFWGHGQSPSPPPEANLPFLRDSLGAVTRIPGDSDRWINLRDAKLGKSWIESSDRLTKRATYHESSVVWLDLPPSPSPDLGQIDLVSGDQISLSPAAATGRTAFIDKLDENSVTLHMFGATIPIPIKSVSSIRFPQP